MEHSLSPSPIQSPSPQTDAPSPNSSMPVAESDLESEKTLWELYERWMEQCKVRRTLDEKKSRFGAFRKNVEYIYSENKTDNFPYELELNRFSDMTIEEFESNYDLSKCTNFKHLEIRDSDVVSEKSLARLYKLWMIRYGVSRSPNEKLKRFVIFKEQVKYIHSENKKDGILYRLGLNRFSDMTKEEFESMYMGICPSEMLNMYRNFMDPDTSVHRSRLRLNAPGMTFDGYNMVPTGDEKAMEDASIIQPIFAMFDARGDAFKNYRGGVLTAEYGKEVGYAATVNGYGVTPCGVKYWQIMCSFGPEWGEVSFLRMKRGVNLCGIESFVSYPILNKKASENSKEIWHNLLCKVGNLIAYEM